MSHNWNTGTQDTFDRFPNLSPAFQLDTIGMRLFHHPDSGGQGFFRVSLVRTERQVYHHQRTIHRFHDRFTMVNHLVEVAVAMSDSQVQDMSWFDFLDDITEPELIQYLKERRLYVNEPVNTSEEE